MADLHSTEPGGQSPPAPPAPPAPLAGFFNGIVNQLPSTIIMLLVVFGGSWLATRDAQNDYGRRIETLEKRAETNSQNIAVNSTALQQNAIRIAEISLIQQQAVNELKEVKEELRRLANQYGK